MKYVAKRLINIEEQVYVENVILKRLKVNWADAKVAFLSLSQTMEVRVPRPVPYPTDYVG